MNRMKLTTPRLRPAAGHQPDHHRQPAALGRAERHPDAGPALAEPLRDDHHPAAMPTKGLTRYTETFDVEPALATRSGPTRRPRWCASSCASGVKFHDGTPFTADDVIFSVQRIKPPGQQHGHLRVGHQGGQEDRQTSHGGPGAGRPQPRAAAQPDLCAHRSARPGRLKNQAPRTRRTSRPRKTPIASRNAMGTGPVQGSPAGQPDQTRHHGGQQGLVGQAQGQHLRS